MRVMRRRARPLLFGVVLLAVSSFAWALPTPPWPGSDVIRGGGTGTVMGGGAAAAAVREAIPLYTQSQLRMMAAGGTIRQAASWAMYGARRYGGWVLLGGTLIYAALDWFYDQAQQATGTDLDAWRAGQGFSCPSLAWSGSAGPGVTLQPVNAIDVHNCHSSFANARPAVVCAALAWNGRANCGAGIQNPTSLAWYSGYFGSFGGASGLTADDMQAQTGTMTATADAHYYNWLIAQGQGMASPSLWAFLDANPAMADVLRDRVMQEFADQNLPASDSPYTWGEPWAGSGVAFDPPLNWNVWTRDPYSDSSVDTDGDGWPDWIEIRLGTDPYHPGSRPHATADPDGDGFSNWAEAIARTDPLDGNDFPSGETPDYDPGQDPTAGDLHAIAEAIRMLEARLGQLLDGVAQGDLQVEAINEAMRLRAELEALRDQLAAAQAQADALSEAALAEAEAQSEALRDIAAALEAILDAVRQDASAVEAAFPTEWTLPEPDLSALLSWQPDLEPARAALSSAADTVGDTIAQVMTAAEGRFPFGVVGLLGSIPTSVGSSCVNIRFTVMGQTGNRSLCDTPLDSFMTGTVRPLLTVLLTFGLIWLIMGWVRQA